MSYKIAFIYFIYIYISLHVFHVESTSELIIETELHPSDCGLVADAGDEVFVHYTGALESGAVFDSSRQQGRQPLQFKLGEGKVIKGWEDGIKGMCVGMKRKLTIPPHLGYGEKGFPPSIPPNSVLVFETELMGMNKAEFDMRGILELLRMLSVPALVIYVVYYLYRKYQSESEEQRKEKKEKKSGSKKRR